jgi:aminocarboxymuconate-semialdehyde decarboxylase
MRIDVHAHYFAPEYTDCLLRLHHPEAEGPGLARAANFGITLDEQLRVMDALGIDLQVLSISLLQPYLPKQADAVEAARLSNDIYADITRNYDGRFAAFASVPLPHVDAAIAETVRALDELGMVGVTLGCSVAGRSVADPAFEPLYAELNRRRAVLFLHPVGQGVLTGNDPYGLGWLVGATFEDTIAALELVFSGITTRFPKVRVIVPHLGGTIPFILERIDGSVAGRRERAEDVPFSGLPSESLKRMWFDAANSEPGAIRCTCQTFGVDRVLFGTDYPYALGARVENRVTAIEQSGLSAEDKAAIYRGNAERLLDLPAR